MGGESGNSTSDIKHFMISNLVPLCVWPPEVKVGGNSLFSWEIYLHQFLFLRGLKLLKSVKHITWDLSSFSDAISDLSLFCGNLAENRGWGESLLSKAIKDFEFFQKQMRHTSCFQFQWWSSLFWQHSCPWFEMFLVRPDNRNLSWKDSLVQ